ncbi:hypothetical protein BDZ45DRAFT_744394 [Acephala macrosclerotiorum]|nr:hypothetical protein BDZ45DRAFT_744394 [Acephala macrosclerotiorum]
MYEKAIVAYKYEKKKRRYNEINDLEYSKHIVIALKLHFNLSEPIDSSGECEMLDTGAEYYIALTHIIRDLGSTITNVENFQLFTITGQNFEFAEVAVMKIEIEHGVEYVNTAYKPKSRKVRLVDLTDGTKETSRKRKNWFERFKARETLQKYTGKYAKYLLSQIASILKGSRLTSKRLTFLLVENWL